MIEALELIDGDAPSQESFNKNSILVPQARSFMSRFLALIPLLSNCVFVHMKKSGSTTNDDGARFRAGETSNFAEDFAVVADAFAQFQAKYCVSERASPSGVRPGTAPLGFKLT